jgi:putative DNA primase/helicase
MRWAWQGGPEPVEVSTDSLIAAAAFVDDYAKPMTERVYGDAALPEVERHAAVLAKYIRKHQMRTINKRTLKQAPHKAALAVMREAEKMDAAVAYLVEAGWLMPNLSREGEAPGRQKQDFLVNPAVHRGV